MVYKFKFVSDEVVNFSREIEIDSDASFLILRNAILDSVGYSKDDIDSFLLCDEGWEGHEEVTLEDMGSSSDKDIWLMEDTPISELVEDEGQRLRFIFDYLTERSFFMELKEIIPGKHLSSPVCTLKKGTPPKQDISIDEFEKQTLAQTKQTSVEDLTSDEDELYGGLGYNDEDIEGFNDLNFN